MRRLSGTRDDRGFVHATDGVPLFYDILGGSGAGSGGAEDAEPVKDGSPTLILNDGIGCEGFAWRYLMPKLAERHRVVHWNYRAHGRSGSPVGVEGLTLPGLAADLKVVMDELEIEKAVLLGHSMGTQVELEAYRLMPERVQAMVLICGSYGRITHTFRGGDMLHRALPAVTKAVSRYRGVARGLWSRVPASTAYRIATLSGEVDRRLFRAADFERYWEHISMMDPDRFLALLDAAGHHSAEDLLPEIQAPTLVIAADGDTFTPPDLAAFMAEQIPGAEHFLVRGATHAAPVEHPLAVQLRIEKFLRERIPSAE